MKWIIAALVLGIFLNLSTASGTSWPIGSVVAVVIMGIYIKISQDRHFEELKGILEKETAVSGREFWTADIGCSWMSKNIFVGRKIPKWDYTHLIHCFICILM